MSTASKIAGTEEAWDSGVLGEDEKFAKKVSAERANEIDDALGLKAVSIRLPAALIEQFKLLGRLQGIGYQPLMRFALTNFAEGETKRLLIQFANEADREKDKAVMEEKAASPKEEKTAPAERQRKAA